MKTIRHLGARLPAPRRKTPGLRARLAEATEALRAIRSGEVDAVVVAGAKGRQVFTLHGAEHAYRVLIESMNEGALTLTADKMILYANQRFARMVNCPLEQVMGSSFRRFLSAEDRATLRPLMRRTGRSGAKLLVQLQVAGGSRMSVQISLRRLARNGFRHAPMGMVVTDLTEARRAEELLRALTHRVVQVQEAERGNVALELHDNITQLLCAVLFRSQALVDSLSARDGPAKGEAMKLRRLVGQTAGEVERISRNLRPGILEQLGLLEVLRGTSAEFATRTGVKVKVACAVLTARLPADTELALFRILQEALRNVEKHAHARRVTVALRQRSTFVELAVIDDGVGFDVGPHAARRKDQGVLGLLGMRERAAYVGGALTVKSGRRSGTEVAVRVPLAGRAGAASRSI